jgi:hypothetical protein
MSNIQPRGFHNPNKHQLELLTQAAQDVMENGHGTHSSGADHCSPYTPKGVNNDLDAPLLSRDRRFVIRIKNSK